MTLPPPSRAAVHSRRVLTGWNLAIFISLTAIRISALVVLGYMILSEGLLSPLLAVPIGALLLAALIDQVSWSVLPLAARPDPMHTARRWKVAVVTTHV